MRPRRTVAEITLLAFLNAVPGSPAAAELVGVEVVHGEAQIQRDGALTEVTVSDRAILEMQSFDVRAHETLRYLQPSDHSRVLNRVLGADASEISGRIEARGSVYLANPNGVFLHGQLVLDVGRFVAAAGQIGNADFLAERDHFTDLLGPVVNTGRLEASGDLLLLGEQVENHGTLSAPAGLVALVAGDRMLLTQPGGHLLVEVERSAPAAFRGAGAGGGGLATGDLYSLAINHSGITRAREIRAEGGDGVVRIAGTLDASAREPGARGGRIEVTGELVSLEGATLDASGAAGGGEIRVGGDWRGAGPLATARRTAVDENSTLRADALESGDGGSAVVWSEKTTGFFGSLSARGAGAGGNGGQAEISGEQLSARGAVDLGAAQGERGTLLYDPREIRIRGGSSDGSDTVAPDPDPDRLTGDAPTGTNTVRILFGESGAEPFEIFESEIEGTDANLVLEATHRIEASGSFTNDADGAGDLDAGETLLLRDGRSLTLRTRNDSGDAVDATNPTPGIDLLTNGSPTLRTTGGGSLSLSTGDNGSGAGGSANADAGISVANLRTESGDVTLSTKQGAIAVGSIDTRGSSGAQRDGGNVSLRAGTSSVASNLVSAGIQIAGAITTRGADETAAAGGGSGSVILTSLGNGDLAVAGAIDSRGGAGTSSGGAGGNVDIDAANGNIDLLSIDSSGGAASAGDGGNAGRAVAVAEAPSGSVDLEITGSIRANGGDGTAVGGSAGNVRMRSGKGKSDVGAIEASGGNGSVRGGNAGEIAVNGGGGNATLHGAIVSLAGIGGSPGTAGASNSVRLVSSSQIVSLVAGDAVHTDGDVSATAPEIGSQAAPLRIDGNGTADSDLSLSANGDAFVEVTRKGFSAFDLSQAKPDANIQLTQEGGDFVTGSGRDASTHALAADTRANAVALAYRLGAAPPGQTNPVYSTTAADLVIPIDGLQLGADGFLESTRDIALGEGSTAGTAIHMTSGTKLTLFADLDKDSLDAGRVRDGIAGAAAGEIATGGATSQVLISAGDGIGAIGDPIALNGGAILTAVTERNDLAIENRASGELVMRELVHAHPVQARSLDLIPAPSPFNGETGPISARIEKTANAGDLSIANAAAGIRIEHPLTTPTGSSASDIALAAAGTSPIAFAVPRNSTGQLFLAVSAGGGIRIDGDVVTEQDTAMQSFAGDIDLRGSIDADVAAGASFAALATAGTTRYGDGVGNDRIGAQAALSNLNNEVPNGAAGISEFRVASVATAGALRAVGDARILGAETRFDAGTGGVTFSGKLDGPGIAVIERADSGVIFGGDVGASAALSRLEVNSAGTTEFRGSQVAAGSGGIALNPLGRAGVPPRATLFRRGGDLELRTPGTLEIGTNEKLSVAGALRIQAASADLGDLNALSIDVESPDIELRTRAPGEVEQRDASRVTDAGLDLVANSLRFSSIPQVTGANPSVRIFSAAGAVQPQPIPNVELRLIDAAGSSLSAASFEPASGSGLLDLTGSGPAPFDDPAGQNPPPPPPVPNRLPPQFTDEAPAAPLEADADAVLAALSAPAEGLPPGPALGGPLGQRIAESAELYRALFGGGPEVQTELRAFRGAVTAAGDRSAAGLRRALESGPDPAAAKRYLGRLGVLLTQLRLLEVSPEVASGLRSHVLERAVNAVDVGGLSAAALGSAADPESPGFRL